MQISRKETQTELQRQIILTSNVKHKDVCLMLRTNHELFSLRQYGLYCALYMMEHVGSSVSTAFSLHQ